MQKRHSLRVLGKRIFSGIAKAPKIITPSARRIAAIQSGEKLCNAYFIVTKALPQMSTTVAKASQLRSDVDEFGMLLFLSDYDQKLNVVIMLGLKL